MKDASLAYFGYTGGVWATDGTIQGTRLVLKTKIVVAGASLRPIGANGMLCEVPDAALNVEIWMLQGTAKAPVRLLTIPRLSYNGWLGLSSSVEYKNKIWLLVGVRGAFSLYSTDGTPKGTVKVASWTGGLSLNQGLVTDGKTLKFIISDSRLKQGSIWTSDGTTKGTKSWIKLPGSWTWRLCMSGGRVFYSSYTTKSGFELWVSDGTKAGTFMVRDIAAGFKSSVPSSITEISPGQVLFSATGDGSNRKEPWISKGTAKSTQQLDLKPWSKALDTADDKVNGIVGLNGKVLFSADDGKTGPELWCSDGTANGTRLIKDIWPGPKGGLRHANMVRFGNKVLFAANDGQHGNEPWISDGTSQGTRMLKNIHSGKGRDDSNPSSFVATGGRAFFLTGVGTAWPKRMWVTDGTEVGTKVLVERLSNRGEATLFALPGGRVLLSHYNVVSPGGAALWVSDGSVKGTKLIWFAASWATGWGREFYLYKGRAFFAVDDGKSGMELWVSDGTNKGTHLLLNIASDLQGKTSSSPSSFHTRGGMLYFQAYTKAKGRALWRSDGTAIGTRYDSKLGVFEGASSVTTVGSRHVYFSARDARGMQNLASMDLQGRVRFLSGINAKGHAWPRNGSDGKSAFAIEDGAIWISAKKHGFDRQLYALRDHAIATPLGDVMASTTLSATDPAQGQSASIVAETGMSQPVLMVMLGLPSRKPWSVPPFYLLYYDFTAFTLPVGIGLGNKITINLPIPLDKSITGAKAMLQAWSLDPRRFPQGLELSNAVHWYVGR